ncbi:MAG: 2Fe-2S iron-sulfur cluster binding domain-containing protein [Steroidobacteraceae bacterium]|nr:2Fe-2S iron-sulfur cluster binding domain-containing protein [Steroidobacteraceae bacterium]
MPVLKVVDRDGVEHDVEAQVGLKVMEVLRELDYGVAAICGGMCSCATCHVYVDPDWAARIPEPMSDEKELLEELSHYEARSRLSCQIEITPALDGLKVTIAPDE